MAEHARTSREFATPPPHLGTGMQQWFSTLVPPLERTYMNIRVLTADTRIDRDDTILICDTSGGNITVTLPPVDQVVGKIYWVKKTSGSNTLTLDGHSTEQIDGSATKAVTDDEASIGVVSDGTRWSIIAEPGVGSGGGGPLGDLSDVTITSVADGELLVYDNASSDWINQTIAEAGLAVSGHTHTESDITDLDHSIATLAEIGDVSVGAISDQQGIKWDNGTSTWVPADLGGGTIYYQEIARNAFSAMTQRGTLRLIAGTGISIAQNDDSGNDESELTFTRDNMDLDDLTDVSISGPADERVLSYDSGGSVWRDVDLATAGIAAASHNHAAGDITSGTFANARIAEGNVTQHEAALSITEAQISDLSASYYNEIARDGFSAMTQRSLLRLIGGTGISISQVDDSGNDESEITFARDAMDLEDLTDVAISGPSDERVLSYDSGGSVWRDVSRATAGIAGLADDNDMSGANDFSGGVVLTERSDLDSKGEVDMNMHYGPGLSISDSAITGAFAIKVPSSFVMHALRVTIYEYAATSGAVQLILGGYARTSAQGDWINTSAGGYGGHISGSDALAKYGSVRFVYHSTYGNMILIGDSGTTWHYPKIFVEDLQGHNTSAAPTLGFFEAGVNAEPTWSHTTTDFVNRHGHVKDITSSTSTPTGEVPYGTLHLIY